MSLINKRGIESVVDFAQAMLDTLNNEHNRDKPNWLEVPDGVTLEKMYEELDELVVEIDCLSAAGENLTSYRGIMREAVDLANVVMMIWDVARRRQEVMERELLAEQTVYPHEGGIHASI